MRRSRTYRPTVTSASSTHVESFTGTTSSFLGTVFDQHSAAHTGLVPAPACH